MAGGFAEMNADPSKQRNARFRSAHCHRFFKAPLKIVSMCEFTARWRHMFPIASHFTSINRHNVTSCGCNEDDEMLNQCVEGYIGKQAN